jgi:hypothetical protein
MRFTQVTNKVRCSKRAHLNQNGGVMQMKCGWAAQACVMLTILRYQCRAADSHLYRHCATIPFNIDEATGNKKHAREHPYYFGEYITHWQHWLHSASDENHGLE